MTSESQLLIDIFCGLDGLLELRDRWEELFSRCRNATFYNDWRWHYGLQKYLLTDDISYILVSLAASTVAIVPIQRVYRRYGPLTVRTLIFPYHAAVDLSDMLVAETHENTLFMDKVIAQLRSKMSWDEICLSQFTERSACAQQMSLLGVAPDPMGFSAFVTSDESDFKDKLSKKQIKNVRRHQKNAETDFGNCNFSVASNEEDIDSTYDTFLKVEISGWKGNEGTKSAIALRPDAKRFYHEVLRAFAATSQAAINILYFGEKPVAGQIGLRTQGRLSLLKIGYDEQYCDYGPGGVALLKCLEAEGGHINELSLVTCPPWSDRWHFATEQKFSTHVFNNTLYASFLRMALSFKRLIARARETLRARRHSDH